MGDAVDEEMFEQINDREGCDEGWDTIDLSAGGGGSAELHAVWRSPACPGGEFWFEMELPAGVLPARARLTWIPSKLASWDCRGLRPN
jgi:hypothetical protein